MTTRSKYEMKTVPHVEYEILKHIIENIDIFEVKEKMVKDVNTGKKI